MSKGVTIACIVCIITLLSGYSGHAQIKRKMQPKRLLFLQPVPGQLFKIGQKTAGVIGLSWLTVPQQTSCKAIMPVQLAYIDTGSGLALEHAYNFKYRNQHEPLLQIKGNILYDVNYRSNIDTPFAEKNIYQHTVQTYLDITWKNQYPFRLYLTNHFGNSSWFKNYNDFNFQYNPDEFASQVKARLIAAMKKSIKYDSLEAIAQSLIAKKNEYSRLTESLTDPAFLQKLIEAKERSLRQKIAVDTSLHFDAKSNVKAFNLSEPALSRLKKNGFEDTLPSSLKKFKQDSTLTGLQKLYQTRKDKLDSLRTQISRLDSMYKRLIQLKDSGAEKLTRDIQELRSGAALKDRLSKYGISDTVLPKGYRKLLGLKTLGMGRSVADYSELSVRNISITGIQAEYNPRYYYAFAVGTVDYHFRDYLVTRTALPKQYLALVRAGKGDKDGNHIFFTYYTGQKQLFNAISSQQAQTRPNFNLMGVTIEGKYSLGVNTFLTVELAKSSLPYYSRDSVKRESTIQNVLQVNNRSNEAYAARFVSFIPSTQTSLDASYRHTGANFQSFSLFNSGAAQTAWSARVSQPFFKHQLLITAAIRKNDYYNPFIASSYSSNSVLKSIQGTLHRKKWPVIAAGYFPSSQLTKLADGRLSQNMFYTVSTSVSHFYRFRKAQFNSMLVYTQFYNSSSDSGFVYFNTKNLLYSQSVFAGRFSLQFNFTAASNNSYKLYVADQITNYKVSHWLTLGAGVKYSRQTVFDLSQWGYSSNVKMKIPWVGDLQMMIDKGFIPGPDKRLVENKVGRITYFKTF